MSRILPFALIAVVLSLPALTLQAQNVFPKSEAVDRAVRSQMENQKIVGVAIGIIQNSKVVYTRGYGYANLELSQKATDQTIFNWASNSKPVMGVLAMQLVEQGQLELDSPISTYLPELPEALNSITTRQLLCHQSGIPHYRNGRIVPSGRSTPSEDFDPAKSMRRFLKSPLLFKPGSKSSYSSYAYVLLSAVVQAAGKQSLEEQLNARIKSSLNLSSFQLDVPFKNQPNWTLGYRHRKGRAQAIRDYAHYWKHGAGGYKSNVRDFARFAMALSNRELLNEATTRKMWTAQSTKGGKTTTYGLGVAVEGSGKNLKVSHNGSQDETKTRMVLYPNRKNGVVVMCNTQGAVPGRISTAIYQALNNN